MVLLVIVITRYLAVDIRYLVFITSLITYYSLLFTKSFPSV